LDRGRQPSLTEPQASAYEAALLSELWRYRYAMTPVRDGRRFLSMELAGDHPGTTVRIRFQHGGGEVRDALVRVWDLQGGSRQSADAHADAIRVAIAEGQFGL
jgi:hypothetical protein